MPERETEREWGSHPRWIHIPPNCLLLPSELHWAVIVSERYANSGDHTQTCTDKKSDTHYGNIEGLKKSGCAQRLLF